MREITDSSAVSQLLETTGFCKLFSFDISPYLSVCRYARGEYLCTQGQAENKLFYLAKGSGKICIEQQNGKVSLVSFLSAPCFVGEIELLKAQSESHSVIATTPCTCFVLKTNLCRERLLNDNTFLRELCTFLSRKTLATSVSHSKNVSFALDVRLADFLLKNAHHQKYTEHHTETAQYLGVSYRHLLYVLARFVSLGYLKKSGRTYWIENEKALRSLALQMSQE